MQMFSLHQGLTGRHVLAALFGFFGLMAVANGFFVYYAVGTFNGFETRDAYRRGLEYNQRVEAGEAQARLGWKASASYDHGRGVLGISVMDQAGAPLAGMSARARVGRPVHDREDAELSLRETSSGIYEVRVNLRPGQWILNVELFAGDGRELPVYRIKDRLWVREGS